MKRNHLLPTFTTCLLLFIAIFWAAEAAPGWTTICHVPPDPDETMQVNDNAVAAHLGHGDYLGSCVTPTLTPTATEEPTAEPTEEPTIEPTATEEPTAEPTEEATPDPTDIPQQQNDGSEHEIVIEKMWLFTSWVGAWCNIISDTHPSTERQDALCGPGWKSITMYRLANAPCAGPVYSNDVWACDDESLDWRMARWPDAEWLHGLGRRSLDEICSDYPKYCGER